MEELRACFVHAGLSHQGGCAWGAWGQAGRGPRFGKLIHPPCPGRGLVICLWQVRTEVQERRWPVPSPGRRGAPGSAWVLNRALPVT